MNAFAITDKGMTRATNQDYVYANVDAVGKLPNLFIVADGMGGHKAGEVASKTAVNTVIDIVKKSRKKDVITILQEAVDNANAEIMKLAKGNSELEGMGTTLVIATVTDKLMYIANVGDSRLYFIDDEIHQITRDHSFVEEMVSLGEIGKEEARTHVKKNIITRAVGIDLELTADFFEVQYEPGNRILMCSDGLSNMIEDDELKNIVNSQGTVEERVNSLVEVANKNGGKDNIAVVLVEI